MTPARYDVPGTRAPQVAIPRPVFPLPPRFTVDAPKPPAATPFTFSYSGNHGPMVKRFSSEDAFEGYVNFWAAHVSPVQWLSSHTARGTL